MRDRYSGQQRRRRRHRVRLQHQVSFVLLSTTNRHELLLCGTNQIIRQSTIKKNCQRKRKKDGKERGNNVHKIPRNCKLYNSSFRELSSQTNKHNFTKETTLYAPQYHPAEAEPLPGFYGFVCAFLFVLERSLPHDNVQRKEKTGRKGEIEYSRAHAADAFIRHKRKIIENRKERLSALLRTNERTMYTRKRKREREGGKQ